jgi:hypothetical protein
MYIVFLQDEYFNNFYIGAYEKLEDSLEDVNKELSIYDEKIDELKEYPSTFDEKCFDVEISKDEGLIMIRGFYIPNITLKEEKNGNSK